MHLDKHKRSALQRGFTLLEVMVVLVIIGLLVAIVAPNVLSNQDKAMVQKAKADIASLEQAMEMYRLDNFRYPSDEQGLEALTSKPSIKPIPRNYRDNGYIRRMPTDPWGNAYQYRFPGKHGAYDLFSFGGNGQAGGEGLDSEIGNWDL